MNPGAARFILLAVCCATLLGTDARRSGVAPGRPWAAAAKANSISLPIVAAAQRIAIDPSTGQVLQADASAPDDAMASGQRDAIGTAPTINAAARDGDEVHLADGTVGVRVVRRYYHTISVCLQADGSFSSACPAAKP